MTHLKLGVVLETSGLPLRRGLAAVSGLAVPGVQVDAAGDLAPGRLTATGRRELGTLLRSYNLELSALRCPLRRGLDAGEDAERGIDHVREALRLAADLGCRAVVVPLPHLACDPAAPRAVALRDALRTLGAFGDRTGTRLALEAGSGKGREVRDYLGAFDTGGLGVGFDPAASVLAGSDPLDDLAALSDMVVHARARDARASAGGGREVPVGAGDVDWAGYVATLESIGYRGYLTVDRASGADRFADAAAGVRFLRRFVPVPV